MQYPKRLVVKIGTSTLTRQGGGLDKDYVHRIAEEVSALAGEGWQVLIVSSGAIRAGMERLGQTHRLRSMAGKQALAAIGQGLLMHTWTEAFSQFHRITAQVLLTRDDFRHRQRFLNARNTLLTLLRLGVIPIINENDTVATEEIQFGDNDTLAALVASALNARLLLILSDVEGLLDTQGRVVSLVPSITEEIRCLARGAGTEMGTGGMQTKVLAAEIATSAGVEVVVAYGKRPSVLKEVTQGVPLGTRFLPKERVPSRKHWIAYSLPVMGLVLVNEGAQKAIVGRGKSLLPSGVVGVEGEFEVGDLVALCGPDGQEFARGLTNYSSRELLRIRGYQSYQISEVLGYKREDEVVHRDNMLVNGARGIPTPKG